MSSTPNEAGLSLVAQRQQEIRDQPQRDREAKERERIALARSLERELASGLPLLNELNYPLLEVVVLRDMGYFAAYPLRGYNNGCKPSFYLTLEGVLLQDYSRTFVDSDDALFGDAASLGASAICQRSVTLDQLSLQQLRSIQAAYLLGLARRTAAAQAEAEAARRPWSRFLKWLGR